MTNELNEAVKRIADTSDNELIVQARPIIAQQAAIIEQLTEALKVRSKQIGVACLKHDLTHVLACGHCHEAQREVLMLVRDKMDVCRSATKHCSNQPTQEAYNASREALTAIDNLMKGESV